MGVKTKSPHFLRGLDPGVARTVAWLNEIGYETTDSGDGVSKPPEGRVFDEPHVVVKVDPSMLIDQAYWLAMMLRSHRIEVKPQGEGPVYIQASYDPADRSATIALFGVNDAMLFPSEART